MNYIESVLNELNLTKKEYIEKCKQCFLKQSAEIQEEIRNAVKYELMLRTDFEIKI